MPPANRANVLTDLQLENSNLKMVLEQHSAEVTRLTNELREARATIDRLRKPLNAALMREDELKEKMEEDEKALPKVLTSDVYVCSVCAFEVVDGYCQGQECGLQHARPPADPLHDDLSISTDTHAINPDHSLIHGSDTSVRGINEDDSRPPDEYRGRRRSEHRELLSRGATRLMCETFHLEIMADGGIHAWVDWEIYRNFAFPQMQNGDFWKIHLGRRIQLDEEDLYGSMLIEDLSEQALMYPMPSWTCNRTWEEWDTIEESPGIWLTRLKDRQEDDSYDYDDLSQDDSSDHSCSDHSSDSDEDRELENLSGLGMRTLNVYSSGDDMDAENDEISDDDGFATQDSHSDSEERGVYDTAFMDFTGPDGAWHSDMDASEDGERWPKVDDDEPQLES
ncbi:hypothetical protein D9619_009326 [Psilocybe cf. subviscida]|uniref:Uncharacterized protein n=1 Tax=Psilocybe cf. subviscida TaxID=2480587 RepID=A0A8H5BUC8_9AGAR|nr:hypothetical protein D9619_009326 [Psilocybe cf. subviscida]